MIFEELLICCSLWLNFHLSRLTRPRLESYQYRSSLRVICNRYRQLLWRRSARNELETLAHMISPTIDTALLEAVCCVTVWSWNSLRVYFEWTYYSLLIYSSNTERARVNGRSPLPCLPRFTRLARKIRTLQHAVILVIHLAFCHCFESLLRYFAGSEKILVCSLPTPHVTAMPYALVTEGLLRIYPRNRGSTCPRFLISRVETSSLEAIYWVSW